MLQGLIAFLNQTVFSEASQWLWFLAPIILPLFMADIAWHLWARYTRYQWQSSQQPVVLEIKLPQETIKSPAAMEVVLNALIQTGGEGTPHERYWKGQARPWASLELVVIEGEIHFFIWCFKSQQDFLTANMYAQYPDIVIHEVEDYTKAVSQHRDKYDVWACEYSFTKADAYPIKTYIDYGLDKDPDEEFKVDPLVSFIESLGTIPKGNQVWFQFIVRAHKAESGIFNRKLSDKWSKGVEHEIQKIVDSVAVIEKEGQLVPNQAKLTTEKKDLIDALSRSVAKFPLDVGIRCIQAYPKDEKSHIKKGVIMGAFRQFGSNNLNNIKPDSQDYDYSHQDPVHHFKFLRGTMTPRNTRLGEHLFRCFCLRSYFFYPYVGFHIPFLPWSVKSHDKPIMVMNTEELATLYHFPGSTARAPGLKRIPSKRADAPSNLPL